MWYHGDHSILRISQASSDELLELQIAEIYYILLQMKHDMTMLRRVCVSRSVVVVTRWTSARSR